MKTNKSEESRIILFNIRAPFFFIWKIEGAEPAISFFIQFLFIPAGVFKPRYPWNKNCLRSLGQVGKPIF